jgi:hypothetical protein
MRYKLLSLLFILLLFPIAKADGCGIVCPRNNTDLLSFTLALFCQLFTWTFCHIFAFIIVAISSILIYVFWRSQSEKKRKTVKMFLYALCGIFVIVLLYPYIKAWTYTPISVNQVIQKCSQCVNGSNGITPDGVCSITTGGGLINNQSSSKQQWYSFECAGGFPVDIINSNTMDWKVCVSSDPVQENICPTISNICSDNLIGIAGNIGIKYYVLMNSITENPSNFTLTISCYGG